MALAKKMRKSGGAAPAKPEKAVLTAERRRVSEILKILKREYPDARCSLDYKTPFELLTATILAAQCTDERVNLTTPALFRKYPGPEKLARADLADLEAMIRSTGFFKNKALSLKEMSKTLVEKHKGRVPETMEALTELRGVGRKTANVVLGHCFGVPGVVVDTHVGRLSRRIGFSRHEDPSKVEQDLMKLIPEGEWTLFSHLLVFHGRKICTARKALCWECPIARYCPKIGANPASDAPDAP